MTDNKVDKLDQQCRKVLEMLTAAGGPPMEQQSPAELRAGRVAAAEGIAAMAGPEEPVAHIADISIPGPAGPVPIRLYCPMGGTTPAPILVYYHGGGWVVGSINEWDRTCRSLAAASGCIVASVEYRLAPEHKYPAAAEDAYAAFQWIADNAATFGGDSAQVAVGGDSAGGNLAAVVCLMARDHMDQGRKDLRQAAFQLLIYPVIDADDDSPSMHEFAEGHFLTRVGMNKFWEFYLRTPADGQLPYASPGKAKLTGLPPAFIITAECDPLRDQGEAYAAKLQAAGVKVEVKRYEGAIHAFFSFAGVIDSGRQAMNDAGSALKRAFGRD